MSHDTCRFCGHVNPSEAKFCNACGGALHLLPCSSCGAVNDVTAVACFACHLPLPGRGTSTPEVPQPPAFAKPSKALPRRRARILVGSAIFAVFVVAGYFGFRQAPHLGAELVIADDRAIGKRDDNIQSVSTAVVQSGIPFAGAVPAAAVQPREDRKAAESRVAKVAAAPVARIRGTSEGRASEREQTRAAACTESVAALGLCTLKPAQKSGAEAVIKAKPIIARSKVGEAGETGRQERRREVLCTDGAAALGLCMPGPTQEGK